MSQIKQINQPTKELEGLKLNGLIKVPNYQRDSFNTTIGRRKYKSTKRFTCSRVNDEYFTVKRVR